LDYDQDLLVPLESPWQACAQKESLLHFDCQVKNIEFSSFNLIKNLRTGQKFENEFT